MHIEICEAAIGRPWEMDGRTGVSYSQTGYFFASKDTRYPEPFTFRVEKPNGYPKGTYRIDFSSVSVWQRKLQLPRFLPLVKVPTES